MMTPSNIYPPGIKAVCVALTSSPAKGVSLIVKTLVNSLQSTFSKQIGLYYLMVFGSLSLGIKEIRP